MKGINLKRLYLFISAIFICLLHLPMVFAKSKPKINPHLKKATVVIENSNSLTLVDSGLNKQWVNNCYDSLKLSSMGLAKQVFDYALEGFTKMNASGKILNDQVVSIVDFSKSSSEKRLFIIDLKNYKVLFNTYVAHGVNSGKEFANDFSNKPESNKSSLGFYKTADTYIGKHGYSLHLMGVEKGVNDNAFRRDIVIHGAGYVNEGAIRNAGFIGRSWGCPAVPENLSRPIINKIKNGTCLFIFGSDKKYFKATELIKKNTAA